LVIDWLVIAVYLLGITAIGVYSSKKVSSSSNFFISDRKFGKWMMTFFTFGTGTNTDQAVSVASKTYVSGASGIWYQWLWLFATPFYWLLAPLFRRMRAVTTADYLNARFGQSVAVLFALVGILQLSVNIGVVLKASSSVITAVSGGAISPSIAIVAMTVLFVSYGVAGGLNAAIVTDFIQGIEFSKLAQSAGLSAAQMAIVWVKDQPGITAPLIGPRTVPQLQEFLEVLETPLDETVREACDQLVPPGSAVANFHNTADWMKAMIL